MWAFVVVLGACTDEPVVEAFVLEPYLPDAQRIDSVPVYGGTLESAPLVGGLVAADPEGDRVLRIVGDQVVSIELGDNARPFRVHVEDARAWVTLRGTGELAAIALDTATVEWRSRVCPEPRGVTRSPSGPLVVACAGGELVEVSDDGDVVRLAVLDSDLRDVVVFDDRLYVSRFATAEILVVDPVSFTVVTQVRQLSDQASVAWRMRASDDGVLVLHQRSSEVPIEITEDTGDDESSSAYGSNGDTPCGTIVDTVITEVSDPDDSSQFSASLLGVTVGTDFVIAADGGVVVASAGAARGAPGVLRFEVPLSGDEPVGCWGPAQQRVLFTPGRAAAVALDGDGVVVIQSAAPLSLARAEDNGVLLSEPNDAQTAVQELFHAAAEVGVSCASCHPEGLDDGHVWSFFVDPTEVLLRRTMPLAGGILSRLPYHWDAAHTTPAALMDDTFVLRMGGERVDPGETTELFDWIDGLRHVAAHPAASEQTIETGRIAFATAGCTACHAGSMFTNNRIEVTGVGVEPVKTPSLLGVGIRDDLLHDGCASDLDDRFDGYPCNREQVPADGHGQVSVLTYEEIEALKAFLRTL